jgi:oligopeptide/dipeptide ABC transporter ATP-binding protein
VMYLGKVVEVADKRSLYARPLHPYTQALLASVPVTHPSQRKRGIKSRLTGDIPTALAPPPGCRFHTRCPHVMPVCRTDEPAMRQAGAGHQAACHLLAE